MLTHWLALRVLDSAAPNALAGAAAGSATVTGDLTAPQSAALAGGVTATSTVTGTLAPTNALRIDGQADALKLSTISGATFTMIAWVRLVVDRNTFSCVLSYESNAVGQYNQLATDADGTSLVLFDYLGLTLAVGTLVPDTWHKVGFSVSGTTVRAWFGTQGTPGVTAVTGTVATVASPDYQGIGSSLFNEWFNGRMSGARVWNAALSDAEVATEFTSASAVRTSNLLGDWLQPAITAGTVTTGLSGANLVQGPPGTPAYTLEAAPNLDPGPAQLAGAVVATATVVGDLTAPSGSMAGVAAGAATVAGALTIGVRFAGAVSATSTVTGTLAGALAYAAVDWQPGTAPTTGTGFNLSGVFPELDWGTGEGLGVKDNSGDGELLFFAWDWTNHRPILIKSGNNGDTWSLIAPTGSWGAGGANAFGTGAADLYLRGCEQTSDGVVHLVGGVNAYGTVWYVRLTLTRTSGAVTGFSQDVAFQTPIPAFTEKGLQILAIRDDANTERLAISSEWVNSGIAHYLSISSGIAPTANTDFKNLAGTANAATNVFTHTATGATDVPHEVTTHLVQIGSGPDLWLVSGPTLAERAVVNPWDLQFVKIPSNGSTTWGSIGSWTSIVGSDSTSAPQLLSVTTDSNECFVFHLDPTRGLQVTSFNSSGAMTHLVSPRGSRPALDGTQHMTGYGAIAVNDDGRMWLIANVATQAATNLQFASWFWSGTGWTRHDDADVGSGNLDPYNSWGNWVVRRWSEGLASFHLGNDIPPSELWAVTVRGGALSTAIEIAGAVAAGSTVAGALTTSIRLAGSVAATSTVVGALTTGISLAGGVTPSSTVAGALSTAIQLAGAVSASSSVAGALLTGIPLAGAVSASSTTTGALSTAIQLAGTISASATVTGALAGGAAALAGAVTATATVTGALSTGIPLAGSVSAAATVAGALSTSIRVAGAVSATASVAGALSTAIALAGSVTPSSVVTGALTTGTAFAGTVAASASVVGALSTSIRLAGTVAASSSVVGALGAAAAALAGSVSASATVAGSLSTSIALAGAAGGAASVTGSLATSIRLAGAVSASSSVAGSLASLVARYALPGEYATCEVSGAYVLATTTPPTVSVTVI